MANQSFPESRVLRRPDRARALTKGGASDTCDSRWAEEEHRTLQAASASREHQTMELSEQDEIQERGTTDPAGE